MAKEIRFEIFQGRSGTFLSGTFFPVSELKKSLIVINRPWPCDLADLLNQHERGGDPEEANIFTLLSEEIR